jgi:hypothetical protein
VKLAIRFTPTAMAEFLAAIDYLRKDKPGAAGCYRVWDLEGGPDGDWVRTLPRRIFK